MVENNDEDRIDVTPNPRILQMLGEIDFSPWQCIAELVDNSLDAYFAAISDNPNFLVDSDLEAYGIHISLPSQAEFTSGNGKVSIQDNGPGMTLEQMHNSVRAGFSGNDPLGKLGLFGMGFNISTARLGRVTTVLSTRKADPYWVVLELDLDEMQKTGQFSAKISKEPKDNDDVHGTIVEVKRLKPEFRSSLTSGAGRSKIRRQLSRTYSSILSTEPIAMEIAELEVIPWKHCIWDEGRGTTIGNATEVKPLVRIDHQLPDHYFCEVCWHWSSPASVMTENTCPACGISDKIELKPRRIHGWIGVQRYFHQEHYGIDFVRNGRIIEQLNKDCFYWTEDGVIEKEYPIDTTHWGGRIVGQINIDFVQVDYQKTAFAKDRREWSEVIDIVRGTSPLRPRWGEERGYAPNTSYLQRIWSVYRSGNKTGIRMLVPGKVNDPRRGDNTDATSWGEKFHNNDPDFQDDSKWWERVLLAERAHRGEDVDSGSTTTDDEDNSGGGIDDPFDDDTDDADDADTGSDDVDHLMLDAELSQRYDFPATNLQNAPSPVNLTVFRDSRILRRGDYNAMAPISIDTREAPNRYTMVYHPKHPAFNEFSETPHDYILMELAHLFAIRYGGVDWNTTRVYQGLKNEYQRSNKLDLNSLSQSASTILSELKEHLATPDISLSRDSVNEEILREITNDVMSGSGRNEEIDSLLHTGRWIERVSDIHIIPVIQENPEKIFDGSFFATAFETIGFDEIKTDTLERIVGCLKDAIMIKKTASQGRQAPDKSLLLRADAALTYLHSQRE